MLDFMVLIHESEASAAALAPMENQALLKRQAGYERKLCAAGAYLDGERLRPTAETTGEATRGEAPC